MMVVKLVKIFLLGLMFACCHVVASPSQDYWGFWDKSSLRNFSRIDHRAWDEILSTYVIDNHASGVNRFRYSEVSTKNRKKLGRYLKDMAKLDPRTYSRREQEAYWLNLYNALTVKLVIDNYPIKSIKDISSGVFKRGPWDSVLIKVAGQNLSLNDIEHRILRPIWKDHKIHFGLNCASVSCPNLLPTAFTGSNVRPLLNQAGRDYINHPRGVYLKDGKMKASSLFKWYQKDFAKDEKTLMKIFAHYADDRLALYLLGFQGKIDYDYDWSLNSP